MKNIGSSPSLLSINLFATRNFLKHSTEGFFTKCFGNLRQKLFDRKSWLNLWSINVFVSRNQWHHKWFPYDFCRHCETKKNLKENLDTSLSLLSINLFATRNFLKHSTEGFLYEMFRHSETKTFRQKNVT